MSHDPYAALRHAGFRRYLTGHVLAVLGQAMMAVAVGWELYERTHSALALGIVGLVQIVPLVTLILPAGHLADSADRRRLLIGAQGMIVLAAAGLCLASWIRAPVAAYYVLLALYGAGRTFQLPAKQAIMPNLLPIETLPNAIAWNSGGWQTADVLGPALGGWLIAWTGAAAAVYAVCAATGLVFVLLVLRIEVKRPTSRGTPISWHSLLEGIRFVRRSPMLLAAMSLDLFAVLLGGIMALLPVYAKDILHVGPTGLGWLRAAQSIGAVATSFALAHRPPMRGAGRVLLWSVAGFGIATVLFGISTTFWFSFVMLLAAGGFDAVSVVIRLALAQVATPDALRGRVSAVNTLFIGMSNELGEFESGFLASIVGPVVAVVAGGVGVIAVVVWVGAVWPEIRTLDRLDRPAA